MVAGWMLYGVLVAALLLAAGLLLEEAGKRLSLPLRGVWAATMAGSVLLPLLARRAPEAGPRPAAGGGGGGVEPLLLDPLRIVPAGSNLVESLGPVLLGGWAIATGCLLLAGLLSLVRLRRSMRSWTLTRAQVPRLYLSADAGPAVVGLFPGAIVLPEWSALHDRRLMLTHEAEHLRAGDPALLLAAHLLVALLPWNLPLWWQLRRLRLAVEVDCDARVLRQRTDLHSYATLLLDVGERRSRLQPALVPFAEPASFLERRIRIMISDRRRKGWIASLALASVAGLLLLVACEADAPMVVPEQEQAASPDEGPVDVYPTPGDSSELVIYTAPGELAPHEAEVPPPPPPRQSVQPPAGARRVTAAEADSQMAYEAAVLDRQPELRNGSQVQGTMLQIYPRMLQDAGVGGRIVLEFVIQADGTVDPNSLKVVEATHEQFVEPSLTIARGFLFRPGLYDGREVRVLVRMPVTWQPPR